MISLSKAIQSELHLGLRSQARGTSSTHFLIRAAHEGRLQHHPTGLATRLCQADRKFLASALNDRGLDERPSTHPADREVRCALQNITVGYVWHSPVTGPGRYPGLRLGRHLLLLRYAATSGAIDAGIVARSRGIDYLTIPASHLYGRGSCRVLKWCAYATEGAHRRRAHPRGPSDG